MGRKHWEKEKLLVTSNFSFSQSFFYPFEELSVIFIKFEIVVCKFYQFGRVWNLSFEKGFRQNKTMVLHVYLWPLIVSSVQFNSLISFIKNLLLANLFGHTSTTLRGSCFNYQLNHSLIHHFETVLNSKKLQTTTE